MTLQTVVEAMRAGGRLSTLTVDAWAAEQTARAEKVSLFRDYVAGDHPQDLTDGMRRMLRIKTGSPLQEFCLNYMDTVVQTLADRLRVVGIDAVDDTARLWAADRLRASGFDGMQGDVNEAALIDGDTFVMAYVDATGQTCWCHEPGFYGENGTSEREKSVRQLIHRVTRTITDWGLADGYFASEADGENFYRDLTWLCLHQHGAFNSPVWFNVGLYHQYGVTGAVNLHKFKPQAVWTFKRLSLPILVALLVCLIPTTIGERSSIGTSRSSTGERRHRTPAVQRSRMSSPAPRAMRRL